jgi:hypothetical protein
MTCNTGKVCNCLVQFLLTIVPSIEERVFISAQRLSERTVVLYVFIFIFLDNSRGDGIFWTELSTIYYEVRDIQQMLISSFYCAY